MTDQPRPIRRTQDRYAYGAEVWRWTRRGWRRMKLRKRLMEINRGK